VTIRWDVVQARRAGVSAQLSGGVAGLMKKNKVRVLSGEAVFTGPKTVSVKTAKGEETLSPDRIIVAAGSVPATIPVPGLKENPNVIDSTGALCLDRIPESMIIIGGGVIGLELATAYTAFGTKCTVVELLPTLLPGMDAELTGMVKRQMEQKGVKFYMEAQASAVEEGPKGAVVSVRQNGEILKLEGEKVLVAVGRKSDAAALNLDAAGIKNSWGVIEVNDRMETNVSGVYAVGDCVGRTMLSHVAMVMGEVAAVNAAGGDMVFDEKTSPSCAYVSPEFAGVGLTEEAARAAGIDYKVGRFPLAANGKSLIVGGTDGMIKVLADKKYNEIIGVHMVGPRATDMIHEAALAIRLECTTEEFVSTIHCHPTVSEAMREAMLAVDKKAIHI
jgi:dihydrolipoamide dehydrogenase